MRAAKRFAAELVSGTRIYEVARVRPERFGSLGATGRGHGSPKALMLGLEGEDPATVDIDRAERRVRKITLHKHLNLAGTRPISFDPETDVVLRRRRSLPAHPNGMTFTAERDDGPRVTQRTSYSIGGGLVINADADGDLRVVADDTPVEYPFTSGAELLDHCARTGLRISDIMCANEHAWRTSDQIRNGLLKLWGVMVECVDNGCLRDCVLPGGLKVPRRAPGLFTALQARSGAQAPLHVIDWVKLYALAVNEKRVRQPDRDGANHRLDGHYPRRPALLRMFRRRRRPRRHRAFSAHRRCDRNPRQTERINLRR